MYEGWLQQNASFDNIYVYLVYEVVMTLPCFFNISIVGVKVPKPKTRGESDENIQVGVQTVFLFTIKAEAPLNFLLEIN
jgi:hypothetical protein